MNFEALSTMAPLTTVTDYTVRDTMLYALGVGAGIDDPGGPEARLLTYAETGLQALPTMASVLGHPGFYMRDPRFGLAWKQILHGEQDIRIHRALPAAGRIRGVLAIEAIHDRGADRGAVVIARRELYDDVAGDHIATVRITSLLRGDGGQGGLIEPPSSRPPPPSRDPDLSLMLPTRIDQALIYRLSGDYNPLHVDPDVAAEVGFDRPILHGLCTYGIAARALIELLCPGRPDRLVSIAARFSRPVYPGDSIRTEVWREAGGFAFRALASERGVAVLDRGWAETGA